MKRLLLFLKILFAGSVFLNAQSIGIGTTSPNSSAKLEVQSVNSGFLTPRMSTAQRDAIAVPATGLMIFNINTAQFEFFNGTEWISVSGGSGKWGTKKQYAFESYASNVQLIPETNANGNGHNLGYSLALNNNFLAAGAPYDYDINGTVQNMGTVRFFKRANEEWNYYNSIYPQDQTMQSWFGYSVALDGNTLMVGAPTASVSGLFNRGKVYFYELDANGTPVFQNAVNAIDHGSGDSYGFSVNVSGNNAVVGAQGYDVGGQLSRGAAYFLTKNNNVWSQQTVLVSPDGLAEEYFGRAVTINGTTAAIAAPWAKVNNVLAVGKVYIYQLVNNTWTYSSTITTPNITVSEKFGISLQLKGDTLFIGASQFNGAMEGKKGKVYIYLRSGNSWNLQTTLSASDGKSGDAFGSSLHYNSGYLIIGAPYAEVYANQSQGKSYVFKLENGNWIEEATLTPAAGNNNDLFGYSVAILPDIAVASSPYASLREIPSNGMIYFFKR